LAVAVLWWCLLVVTGATVETGEELLQVCHGEGDWVILTVVSESEEAQQEPAERMM
jgi:hypothetical protein